MGTWAANADLVQHILEKSLCILSHLGEKALLLSHDLYGYSQVNQSAAWQGALINHCSKEILLKEKGVEYYLLMWKKVFLATLTTGASKVSEESSMPQGLCTVVLSSSRIWWIWAGKATNVREGKSKKVMIISAHKLAGRLQLSFLFCLLPPL